ncbi:MAG: hypothetical protein LAT62_11225 [Natronospirillum sp.]|uniref:hypothetical protein n=1 Tax=Natronospirillum sp. TaxID=2812955 RepID=UPI0025DFD1D1|nr:hypothetical protein [Natronospirillum sp.]MCH8552501.1 hypothetical protein [Natronospirillum sp.]
MNYAEVGKALEETGKKIQKANNQLDKVLEKLVEFEDLSERKSHAIEQINGNQIRDAIATLQGLEKDQLKAEKLAVDETRLREEIKALMAEAEKTVAGKTEEAPALSVAGGKEKAA